MSEYIYFDSGVTGLTDVGYRFFKEDGTWSGSRVTSGVFEVASNAGVYGASASIPSDAKGVYWNSSGTTAVKGTETFDMVGAATITASLAAAHGYGAFVVTVTVTDSVTSALLENAVVRLTEGANTFTALTNASGVATFSLDAATYTRSITKPGYSMTPDTITVTGAANFAKAITPTGSIAVPADPDVCALYGTLFKPNGEAAANVTVLATLTVPHGGAAEAGGLISGRTVSTMTNGSGLFSLNLIRTDTITTNGCSWRIQCAPAALDKKNVKLTTSTKDIATLIP